MGRSSRKFPTEAAGVQARGLVHRVRFTGRIAHGASTREIAMDVHPDLIVKIAAALLATKDCACDSAWQKRQRHHSEFGWQVGHAMWHVEHPEDPMPCLDHSKVIDVPGTELELQGDSK